MGKYKIRTKNMHMCTTSTAVPTLRRDVTAERLLYMMSLKKKKHGAKLDFLFSVLLRSLACRGRRNTRESVFTKFNQRRDSRIQPWTRERFLYCTCFCHALVCILLHQSASSYVQDNRIPSFPNKESSAGPFSLEHKRIRSVSSPAKPAQGRR